MVSERKINLKEAPIYYIERTKCHHYIFINLFDLLVWESGIDGRIPKTNRTRCPLMLRYTAVGSAP